MSFEYQQSTGILTHDGEEMATGYAGCGEGLNNPAMQDVHKVGPLPQGLYTILPPCTDPKVGIIAMRLIPDPANEMYGRADFFCHGDNEAMNHTASEGCMVMPHNTRVAIGTAVVDGDDQLTVIA